MGKVFTFLGLLSLGIYRLLTLIGILLGVVLFSFGIRGFGLHWILAIMVGIFVTIKEIMDSFQYVSFLNFFGIAMGLTIFYFGFKGGFGSFGLTTIGVLIFTKEIIDLVHSGG